MGIIDKIESKLSGKGKPEHADVAGSHERDDRGAEFRKPLKRVALAVTSAHRPMYPDGGETGVFIGEALHPYNAFIAAGFEVTFTSETGEWAPDVGSLKEDFLPAEERKLFEDEKSGFRKALNATVPPDTLNPSDFGVFFASAGHASLIDYPTATKLQSLASTVYTQGGVVSAVCHGPAVLAGLKLPNGEFLAKGKRVTGFTDMGEDELGVMAIIRDEWKLKTCKQIADDVGALYVSPDGAWDEFTVTDGRLVTGVNPQSAKATAEAAIAAYNIVVA